MASELISNVRVDRGSKLSRCQIMKTSAGSLHGQLRLKTTDSECDLAIADAVLQRMRLCPGADQRHQRSATHHTSASLQSTLSLQDLVAFVAEKVLGKKFDQAGK